MDGSCDSITMLCKVKTFPKNKCKLPENVLQLFDEVKQKITQNLQQLMEELWLNWSHMGLRERVKTSFITKLVEIEKDLQHDILKESHDKLKILEDEVDKLHEEAEELSKCLCVDITLPLYNDNDMLIDYKNRLEQQIVWYREQVEQRRAKMKRLMLRHQDLTETLGVPIQNLEEMPLPSETDLDEFNSHLVVLQKERDKRAEMFSYTQIQVKEIMEKLQIKPQNEFEHDVMTSLSMDFKMTDLNMDRVSKLQQDLQEKFEQTNKRVLELRERLTKMWDCTDKECIYRENFMAAHQGFSQPTETAITEEMKRYEQVYVADMRSKIKQVWDTMLYSQAQREEFMHYFNDIITEESIILHELYLDKISKVYNDHKHIYNLVHTRKSLRQKMTELEARASEPGRYNNRGGQLLKEEKMRNTIANKLPKIEDQLRTLVSAYETESGNTFTVGGKPLLQLITDDWNTRKPVRHDKLSVREQALMPKTTNPLLRSLATVAGPANTYDQNRLPAKRQPVTRLAATSAATTLNTNHSVLKRYAISPAKSREAIVAAAAAGSPACAQKNTIMESTMFNTHTDFKDRINENQEYRSALINENEASAPAIRVHREEEEEERDTADPPKKL